MYISISKQFHPYNFNNSSHTNWKSKYQFERTDECAFECVLTGKAV